jgi:hypothetical protein
MKSTKSLLLPAVLVLLAVSAARAQTIQYIIVGKEQYFTQNTNSTASAGTNYQFSASIEGSSLSGIATPNLNSNSAGGTGPTGPFVYNSGDDAWYIEQNYSTGGDLETAYPSGGSFSLTVLGEPVSIAMPSENPLRFTPIPLATLSAGTIVGGVLTWDVSQPLTISLIDPLNGSFATVDHINLSIWGTNIDLNAEAFGNATQSFTIPGTAGVNNTFIAGQTYTVEMGFVNITGGSSLTTISGGALDGVQYGGIYGRTSSFTIQAIPEPSTYAAMAGALALGLAAWRRRRQATA